MQSSPSYRRHWQRQKSWKVRYPHRPESEETEYRRSRKIAIHRANKNVEEKLPETTAEARSAVPVFCDVIGNWHPPPHRPDTALTLAFHKLWHPHSCCRNKGRTRPNMADTLRLFGYDRRFYPVFGTLWLIECP